MGVPEASGDAAQARPVTNTWAVGVTLAARLRELLGDQLDDPDARFELEIALRTTTA